MTTPQSYKYLLIDVFTDQPFCGKPLAVLPRADGLSTEKMQQIARELGCPETTFVLSAADPANDYSVRVFTPEAELPTTGHPSIGTAFAIALEREQTTAQKRMVFEGSGGPISTHMLSPMTTVKQPLPVFGSVYPEPSAATAILSLTVGDLWPNVPLHALSAGVPYLMVPLGSEGALSRIRLRSDIWSRTVAHFEAPQIFAFALHRKDGQIGVSARMFAPALGVHEDPATEMACGPLVAYMLRYGLLTARPSDSIVVEQGADVRRPSRIHVLFEHTDGVLGRVRIGGQCVGVGEGTILVP